MVREVKDLEEFKQILKEAGDKLVVVDFTATWCGPCKKIGPVFEDGIIHYKEHIGVDDAILFMLHRALSHLEEPGVYDLSKMPENSHVLFLKVDVDEAEDVSSDCKIQCMPTFQFYKRGEKVFEFSGANDKTLKEKLEEMR